MIKNYYILLLCLGFFLKITNSFSQVSIYGLTGMSYSQDFDGLPNSGSSYSISNPISYLGKGWYTNTTTLKVRDGNTSSTDLISIGTTGDSDRALGSRAGSGDSFVWGVRFVNDTGEDINSITISYYGEQWRDSDDESQIISFSYKVSTLSLNTIDADEIDFLPIPELNFVSISNTDSDSGIDGNNTSNKRLIRAKININIPIGSEIMMKWFDEDDSSSDHILGIDDLSIEFHNTSFSIDEYTGEQPFYEYGFGIVERIPDDTDSEPSTYITPSNGDLIQWRSGLEKLIAGNISDAMPDFETLDYKIIKFNDPATGEVYYVLRRIGNEDHYWGIYFFNLSAALNCLTIQAPHPLNDGGTSLQGTYLFTEVSAYSYFLAGIHRCFSNTSTSCTGSSGVCSSGYKISDYAHHTENMFQLSTEIIGNEKDQMRFLQLHGFSKNSDDPYFIISNGTRVTPEYNPDYAVVLGNYLSSVNNTLYTPDPGEALTYETGHLDNSRLAGTVNIQGRYLNNYSWDICTSTEDATFSTGRFIHMEQYRDFRVNYENYSILRDAVLNCYDCNVVLPVELSSFRGEVVSTGVVIHWITESEINNDYFIIEKSVDSRNFYEIGRLDGMGNSQTRQYYTFHDPEPVFEKSYYRLKQIDFDGSYDYSKIIMIDRKRATDQKILVYPIPVRDVLKLEISSFEQGNNITWSLENVFGYSVLRGNFSVECTVTQISMSGLSSGIYFLRIYDKQEVITYRVYKL